MADDLTIKIGAETSSLVSSMAEVKTTLEAITKVLSQFATSMSGFATTMGSMAAPLSNLNAQLGLLSEQQVSRTKNATETILDSYKKRIAAIEEERKVRKAEIDAFAATKTPAVGAAYSRTAEADLAEENKNKKIAAAKQYHEESIKLANAHLIALKEAEQKASLLLIESQKGYQNARLASGQQYNAARLGLEIQLIRDLQAVELSGLSKTGKADARTRLKEQELANQKDLYQNYANQIVKIETDGAINATKERERIAKYSEDKVGLIKIQAEKEIIKRIAALQAEAVKKKSTDPGALIFNPDDQKATTAAIAKWKQDNSAAIAAITEEVNGLALGFEKVAKAQMNEAALQALNQLAIKATAAGAALSAAFVVAIKPAMELEKALSAVAAVSQVAASSSGMVALRDLAIDLGRQFLFSSGEIANGMKNLAQAGFDVPEIREMSRDILNLATAADMPLKDAFNIASTTLRAFKMEATEMGRVSNTLTSTANMTNVEVTDLAESFKYIGPVAAAAGVEFEDVSAALGIMGNAGIKGSMGGTALRQSISALIAPTSQQRTMIRELGLQITKANGDFVGFADIVRQMEGVFTSSIIDPAQQAGIAMKLFGDRAGPGMLAIIKEGHTAFTSLAKDLKDSAQGTTEGGAAAKTAADRMKNLTDQVALFGKATSGLATTVLFPILDILGKIVTKTNEWINLATDFFTNNPWAANAVSAIVLIGGALGAILTTVGALTAAFATMGLALTAQSKHGIKWLSLLTFGLKGTTVAAGQAAVGVAAVGTAGRVAMGLTGWIGIALTALTVLGPIIYGLVQSLRGASDASAQLSKEGKGLFKEQAENAKVLNSEYETNAELAQELIDKTTTLGEIGAAGPPTRLQSQLLELAPAPLRKTGQKVTDATGKLVDETVNPTLEETQTRLAKIRQSLIDTRAESETLNANETLTTEEYLKQKLELDQIFNIKKNLGLLTLKDLDNQIKMAQNAEELERNKFEAERTRLQGNVPTPESLEGGVWMMPPEEQKAWLDRIDSLKKVRLGLIDSKKEFLAMSQVATNDIKMPFIRDLEGIGNLLEQANRLYAERNKLRDEDLALEKSLMEVTDTHLTMEEKQFAFSKKFVDSKIAGAKTELAFLKKLQEETNKLFKEKSKEIEGGALSQASARALARGEAVESATVATGGEPAYKATEVEKEINKIKVAANSTMESVRAQYGAIISSVVSTLNQATSSVSRLNIEIIQKRQQTYEHMLKLQGSYLKQTMAMSRDEFDQKAAFLRKETEAAKNEDDIRKGLEAEGANARAFQLSETAKAAALMAKMSPSELGGLAQQSSTARRILEEQKKNQQALDAESKKSNTAKVMAMLRNADIAGEENDRINRQIKENTQTALDGALKVQDANSKMLVKFKSELDQANIDWQIFYDGLAEYQKDKPALVQAKVDMAQVDKEMADLKQRINDTVKEPKIITIKFHADATHVEETVSSLSSMFKNIFSAGAAPIAKKATGGFIGGSGSGDIVPAMLEPGEFVMRKSSVRSFGAAFFAALNNMSSPSIPPALSRIAGAPRLAFAAGGLVPKKGPQEKTIAVDESTVYNLRLQSGAETYNTLATKSVIEAMMRQIPIQMRKEGATRR